MSLSCGDLQQLLHREIPLSRAMEIRVSRCDSSLVELRAPLQPNINHKCTAFGGSLYSIAVLCGWSFVYRLLSSHQLSGHIVIQHSEVDYIRPLDGEICARCQYSDMARFEPFIKLYQRRGRSRIKLQVKLAHNGEDAVSFNGQYVVHR